MRKNYMLNVVLNKQLEEFLRKESSEYGISMAEYIRQLLLKKKFENEYEVSKKEII